MRAELASRRRLWDVLGIGIDGPPRYEKEISYFAPEDSSASSPAMIPSAVPFTLGEFEHVAAALFPHGGLLRSSEMREREVTLYSLQPLDFSGGLHVIFAVGKLDSNDCPTLGCWCSGYERTSLWALIPGTPKFEPLIASHDYFNQDSEDAVEDSYWLVAASDLVCEQLCAVLGISSKSGRLGQVIQLVFLASVDRPLWDTVEALHARRGESSNFFSRHITLDESEEEDDEMFDAGEAASGAESNSPPESAAQAFPRVNGARSISDNLELRMPQLLERLKALALRGRLGFSLRLIDVCMQLNSVLYCYQPGAASPTEPKTGPASPAINHESAAGPSRMHALIHDKSAIFMHHSREQAANAFGVAVHARRHERSEAPRHGEACVCASATSRAHTRPACPV